MTYRASQATGKSLKESRNTGPTLKTLPTDSRTLRQAVARLLSSSPRGFTPEQRKALCDYEGPMKADKPRVLPPMEC